MKRIFALLCVLVTTVALCGCGDEVFDVGTPTRLQIPVSNGTIVNTMVPSTLTLQHTDNQTFWEYDNGVTVRTFGTKAVLSDDLYAVEVKNSVNGFVNVNMNYLDGSISITCPKSLSEYFKQQLQGIGTEEQGIVLNDKNVMKELPKYTAVEMQMNRHNLYMPIDAQDNDNLKYIASITTDGTKWMESWVKDGTYEQVTQQLLSIAYSNSENGATTVWYANDEIFYVEYGNHICATKKLSLNQWYIYTATVEYRDYVLQGLNKIHRGE